MTNFQLPDRNDPNSHNIVDGFSFEWLHDGQIVSLTVENMGQKTVDVYFDTVQAIETSLHGDYLMLIDLSKAGSPTPYFKARLKGLEDTFKGVASDSKVAIVIPSGIGASIFLGFTRIFGRSAAVNVGTVMFQNRDKALRWLADFIEA